jgi:hypothetical protein
MVQLIGLLPPDSRDAYAASLARVDGDADTLSALLNVAIDKLGTAKNAALRGALDTIAVAGECGTRLQEVVDVLARMTGAIANEVSGTPNPITGRWDVIESARLVGHVLSRLLTSGKIDKTAGLVERVSAILAVLPSTSEFLTTIPREVLGATYDDVRTATTDLLRGAVSAGDLSRRQQRYAGLRGAVRALVQVGVQAMAPEWLPNIGSFTQATDGDLAQYAAWILSEWARRQSGGEGNGQLAMSVLAPMLRTAACDSRVWVRANGLRGLVALEQTSPSAGNRAMIEAHRVDTRIAIIRALAGFGTA